MSGDDVHQPPQFPPPLFPDPNTLCETCGYALQGLAQRQACPECGAAVYGSSPAYRPGLPWQNKRNVRAWLTTSFGALLGPGTSFRRLRIGGSNRSDRLFLGTWILVLSMAVFVDYQIERVSKPWLWAVIVASGIPAATYIEALGITFFSYRRGWRVPFELAERVACYASVGWMPAVLLLSQVQVAVDRGLLYRWWNPQWGPYTLAIDVVLSAVLLSIGVLWFEILIWIGVRKVRYGNAASDG